MIRSAENFEDQEEGAKVRLLSQTTRRNLSYEDFPQLSFPEFYSSSLTALCKNLNSPYYRKTDNHLLSKFFKNMSHKI